MEDLGGLVEGAEAAVARPDGLGAEIYARIAEAMDLFGTPPPELRDIGIEPDGREDESDVRFWRR